MIVGIVLASLTTLSLLFLLGVHWFMIASAKDQRAAIEAAPPRTVALVLGAAVWGDRPSHMLEDRLAAALDLYQRGRCRTLLLSGAHREDENEVAVMRAWLERRGVPPEHIFLDHAGFRTLDSMIRAKEVFHARELLVVTQDFHIPRSLYLGRSFGLDVIGVSAPPIHNYTWWTLQRHAVRELIAQTKAFLDVEILRTRPKFLGPSIDLAGDGTITHG